MSDNSKSTLEHFLGHKPTRREVLFTQITMQMGWGFVGGIAVFAICIVVYYGLILIGSWLPPESKEMPDPNILWRSSIEQPLIQETARHA